MLTSKSVKNTIVVGLGLIIILDSKFPLHLIPDQLILYVVWWLAYDTTIIASVERICASSINIYAISTL